MAGGAIAGQIGFKVELTPNVEDAADQLSHRVDRVNSIAFVIIPLARDVWVAIPVIGREAAVIDVAIIAPG